MRIVLSSIHQSRREPAISQVVDLVTDRLRQAGVRLTSGRRHVVEALAHSRGPVSAAEISAHLDGSVPLSSIYRTLSVLTETDLASPHHSRDGVTRYEFAEPLQDHHHHLVCVECGRIDDVELQPPAEAALHQLSEAVAADHSFAAVDHSLEIEGRCEACS